MKPSDRPRYRIWQLMLWIAWAASALVITRLANSPYQPYVFGALGFICVAALLNAVIDAAFAKVCPTCSRRSLWQLARHHGYYRCRECGARFKRFGFSRWLDASGPEDEHRYRKRSEAGNWKGFVAPKDPKGSNSGASWRASGTGTCST